MSDRITYRDVPGWFDWLAVYDEVALTTPPHSTIVEIGVAFGKSLLYLCERLAEAGRPDVRVIAVDPWLPYPEHHFIYDGSAREGTEEAFCTAEERKHGGVYNAFMHNLRSAGYAGRVDVWPMTSEQALDRAAATGLKTHFVFVDGYHVAEAVAIDLQWWDKTSPEWMAGHDYNRGDELNFPGVWKTVDARFGQENVEWVGQTTWVVRRAHLERPR
jgi:hypothetical protein